MPGRKEKGFLFIVLCFGSATVGPNVALIQVLCIMVIDTVVGFLKLTRASLVSNYYLLSNLVNDLWGLKFGYHLQFKERGRQWHIELNLWKCLKCNEKLIWFWFFGQWPDEGGEKVTSPGCMFCFATFLLGEEKKESAHARCPSPIAHCPLPTIAHCPCMHKSALVLQLQCTGLEMDGMHRMVKWISGPTPQWLSNFPCTALHHQLHTSIHSTAQHNTLFLFHFF